MDRRLSADHVVDLLRYKQQHPQRRLALVEDKPPSPALAPVTRFRPLSTREVDHRASMLKHLTSSR